MFTGINRAVRLLHQYANPFDYTGENADWSANRRKEQFKNAYLITRENPTEKCEFF